MTNESLCEAILVFFEKLEQLEVYFWLPHLSLKFFSRNFFFRLMTDNATEFAKPGSISK